MAPLSVYVTFGLGMSWALLVFLYVFLVNRHLKMTGEKPINFSFGSFLFGSTKYLTVDADRSIAAICFSRSHKEMGLVTKVVGDLLIIYTCSLVVGVIIYIAGSVTHD